MISARQIIERLGLEPHPEDGRFRETWVRGFELATEGWEPGGREPGA